MLLFYVAYAMMFMPCYFMLRAIAFYDTICHVYAYARYYAH